MIFLLIAVCSCLDNELNFNKIKNIDNEFVDSNFSYTFLDLLEIDKESGYYSCLLNIAISKNDKDSIEGAIFVGYEETQFNTYHETGLLFYYLSKIRRSTSLDSMEFFDAFLGKNLGLNYISIKEIYKVAYKKDFEKKNMWVRLGISIVLTENRYYQEAIDYLIEAESINQDNNYLKELMINNLLLQGDSITAKVYLNKIPKSYKFNEIDKNIRNTLRYIEI